MAKQRRKSDLTGQLLAWYDAKGRDLPWRVKGRPADPYHVWLSEIMLQQTTVAAVKPYFARFLASWPTIEALAKAPLDEVLRAWAGLGYYARARNLHHCARVVAGEGSGRFPADYDGLRKLPGIGPYTAGAISAIAFGGRHAAVDGNVERVLSRFYAIEEPLPDSKPVIRGKAEAMVPDVRAGDFAQAMMDLGATVCTPKSPDCGNCPWAEECAGLRRGIAGGLPNRRARKALPTRHGTAFWIERGDGAVLLRRRPDKGLLGGMMEVPSTGWDGGAGPPLAAKWKKLPGLVTHTFTHFHLELEVRRAAKVSNGELLHDGDYRWVSRSALSGEALPTVMRKVVALVQSI
jgi:A/G-specific adenine glycosylase